MTQEDRKLLLTDLCARLPYGVKALKNTDSYKIRGIKDGFVIIKVRAVYGETEYITLIETIKPYLRPMSSMTEEECKTLGNISATLENRLVEVLPNTPYYIEVAVPDQIDWLNAHHFDYRGLIPMGLALEAPEGMYNIK